MGVITDSFVGLARALQAEAPSPRFAPTDHIALFDVLITTSELRAASRKLFVDTHYAKSVEEGEKALIEYVQERANRPDLEGTGAMTRVFSRDNPILRVNSGRTKWEKDEQEGYMHHFAGSVLMGRNPRVHNYRLVDTPEKALKLLCLIDHLFDIVNASELVSPSP